MIKELRQSIDINPSAIDRSSPTVDNQPNPGALERLKVLAGNSAAKVILATSFLATGSGVGLALDMAAPEPAAAAPSCDELIERFHNRGQTPYRMSYQKKLANCLGSTATATNPEKPDAFNGRPASPSQPQTEESTSGRVCVKTGLLLSDGKTRSCTEWSDPGNESVNSRNSTWDERYYDRASRAGSDLALGGSIIVGGVRKIPTVLGAAEDGINFGIDGVWRLDEERAEYLGGRTSGNGSSGSGGSPSRRDLKRAEECASGDRILGCNIR